MDKRWLKEMFKEAGLEGDQVDRAVDACLVRLLKRERPSQGAVRRSLVEHLVRDPLLSVNRILGRGDGGLPFVDEEEDDKLSLAAFGNLLSDSGLDPVVAMAYAKVVVEAYQPKDLYQPVWKALGREGDVDFESLRREDWSPLRTHFADLLPPDLRPTEQVRAQKPRAQPPAASKKPPK